MPPDYGSDRVGVRVVTLESVRVGDSKGAPASSSARTCSIAPATDDTSSRSRVRPTSSSAALPVSSGLTADAALLAAVSRTVAHRTST
jgi:hypothetical protein